MHRQQPVRYGQLRRWRVLRVLGLRQLSGVQRDEPGVCTTVLSTTDDTCQAPKSCDATGVCRAAQGQSCTVDGNCLTGHCVDLFCCDTACSGTCQACSAAAKEGGTSDGACGPAANGQNPHGDCTVTPASACQTDGFCSGTGQCRKYAAGTACGSGVVCEPTTNSAKGQLCNGNGVCLPSTADGTPCGEFDCVAGTGCGSTCAIDADCIPTAYCDANVCKPKTADGATCEVGDSCVSGVCVDSMCCNRPCDGQCEACDVKGAEGKCVPVVGAPHTARAACAGAAEGNVCSATSCNGDAVGSCKASATAPTAAFRRACRVARSRGARS